MAYEKKEKTQSYISDFKREKWPIRPNNILHLKMLADLGEQETSEMNEKC